MKKLGILFIAAILGSAFTIATFEVMDLGEKKTVRIEHIDGTPARSAVYTMDKNGEMVPLDFTGVADNVMDAVVHIKSVQTIQRASGNMRQDPFHDFFNDDFFEHFFGPRFRYENPRGNMEPQKRIGAGSGVIISKEGYIVTNNHVVDMADDVEVTLHDNRTYKAKVIGKDPSTDLAVLQIKEDELTYVPFVNSDDVKVGEWVLAIGNPFNLNSTVTAGIVSAKARNINILKDRSAIESFIQTDAAINPGNSGGALVDLNGGLIGINTAIASPTGSYAGYGFAVPSNIVKKVVADIMEFGVVQRGYLGVMIRDVNAQLAKDKGLDITKGVYVDSLMANSAAKSAGVKEGDVILKVNEIEVNSAPELQEVIARFRPGDEVELTLDRKGKEKTYEITLNNREGTAELAVVDQDDILDVLGVELKEVDTQLAQKLGIEGGLQITEMHAGVLQKETTIKEGFIITKVNDKKVSKVKDFVNIMRDKKGGIMFEGVYENYPGQLYYAFGL